MTRLFVILALCVAASAIGSAAVVVQTDSGPVRGFLQESFGKDETALSFRGIPYAAPPVGSLRFSPPQPPTPWTSVLNATEYGAGCPQNCTLPPHGCPAKQSESCLFLNVWAPTTAVAAAPNAGLPVLVWIHGGHFEQGSGEGPLYDSLWSANETETVVVTINYRLGALGFLHAAEGNAGIRDQILALKWVQSNIRNFGGDPAKVTIYGQSAGGTSVAVLMAAPAAEGLFAQVIMESNPAGLPMSTVAQSQAQIKQFGKLSGCGTSPTLDCLRGLDIETILAAQKKVELHFFLKDGFKLFYNLVPLIDHDILDDQPLNLFLNGHIAKVPLVLGTVESEGRMFVWEAFDDEISNVKFDAFLGIMFGIHAFKVGKMYPPAGKGNNRDRFADLASDYLFTCPNRAIARAMAQRHTGSDPRANATYAYRYTHVWSESLRPAWGPDYKFCWEYACHASELPFVFNVHENQYFDFSDDEVNLASRMATNWATFARTGQPPSTWPVYDGSQDNYQKFETPADSVITDLRKTYCDFWDSVGYKF